MPLDMTVCPECHSRHFGTDYPADWKIAGYFTLKYDGAAIRCDDCGNQNNDFSRVILVQYSCGRRRTFCLDCVDTDYLHIAKHLGKL